MAFVLMPNHFHLMLRQHDERAMPDFMRRVGNGYVEYFNQKYERVGSLFQGPYKAVLVNDGAQLVSLTRYLHRNPDQLLADKGLASLADYPYSSYSYYLGLRQASWLDPREILQAFQNDAGIISAAEYREFVENFPVDGTALLKGLTLEQP